MTSSASSRRPRRRGDSGFRERQGLSTLDAPDSPDPVDVRSLPPEKRPTERYEAARPLGKGGMGEVLLCRDNVIGRQVAFKRIKDKINERKSMRARFLREARIQAQLEHPTVVPVYDLGIDPEGRPFFTMRRVTGDSLDDVLWALDIGAPGAEIRFSQRRVLGIFRQVCLGIDYAHQRGVVHRDLKPANIMVGHWGEVHILDWGLAKLVGEAGRDKKGAKEAYTTRGELLGTPGYMAPEQAINAAEVDERADVYALGAILFELLTLIPLHEGNGKIELLKSTHRGRAERPSEVAPESDIAPELDEICQKATAVKPDDRYPSARALCDALDRYLDGERDTSQRRRMAERSVRTAQKAAVIDDPAHREVAIREARRAIVLDPESKAATELLLSLSIEPRAETPDELMDKQRHEVAEEARLLSRFGIVVYGGLFGAVVALNVASGPTLASVGCAMVLGLATSVSARSALGKVRDYEKNFLVLSGLVSLAIALAAPFAGVFSLLPQLAVAHALSLNFRSVGHGRVAHISMATAAFAVPYLLDWVGVIGPYDVVAEGGIDIHSSLTWLPADGLPYLSVVVTVLVIAGAAAGLRRLSQSTTDRERQLHLRLWHLEQMLPGYLRPRTDIGERKA